MDTQKNHQILIGLFAHFFSQGMSTKLGRQVRCSFLQASGSVQKLTNNSDLCFYLNLGQGERWALLARRVDLVGLIGLDGARSKQAGKKVEALFISVLRKSCVLVGMLSGQKISFQGCSVIPLDVSMFRSAFEKASTRRAMSPVDMKFQVGNRLCQMGLLVPDRVMQTASEGLARPEHQEIQELVTANQGLDMNPGSRQTALLDRLDDLLERHISGSASPQPERRAPDAAAEGPRGDQSDYGDKGVIAYCVFDSLADLSDRDMRLILDSAQVREAGSRSLSCALSQSSPGLQQKIFGNLSVNRKRDVQDGLAEEWDMQDVQEAQAVIKEVAFVLALQKRIQPPPSIQRQFDKYFISWNAWQNELSKSVRQEFIGLPENLSAEDLALTVRNSKREDLLWALQECDLSLVDAFLAGISATQRKMMVEDLPVTLKKVKRRIDLRYNVIKARQAILNIGQKVLRQ